MKTESLDLLIERGHQFAAVTDADGLTYQESQLRLAKECKQAIRQITEPHREIFLLYADGFTQIEIANRVHRHQSAVSRSIRKTRAKLLLILNRA